MDTERCTGLMALFTKVNGAKENNMVVESSFYLMGPLEKAISRITLSLTMSKSNCKLLMSQYLRIVKVNRR